MIVRHFLDWIRSAPAGQRAEATSALARAYLYSDLSVDDAAAAEGAMLMLLDDVSPLVRRALADTLAASPSAPPAIVLALAAAIAEVGTAESCLALLENGDADVAPFSIDRIAERHGHLAAIREPLLAREDIAPATRLTLVAKLSETLAGFVAERQWLDADHAQRVVREACEKATLVLAADTPVMQMRPLIHHLRVSGQLTAGLILRALLSGNLVLFEEALAELTDMPVERVSGLVHDSGNAGLRALFDQAGLPPSTYPAFKEAIGAMREGDFVSEPGGAARLKRRMIERVLTRCEDEALGELEPLLTLLRRFATEAAREEARLFCDELVAESLDDEQQSEAA
jgi:uncharacterized protein (DUF2336 family)